MEMVVILTLSIALMMDALILSALFRLQRRQLAMDSELVDAVKQKNPEKTQALINEGANVNFKDRYGCTPLMYAMVDEESGIADLLLEAGAHPWLTNRAGKSILEMALENNRSRLYEKLQMQI